MSNDSLRKLQLTELDILQEFIRVCEEHGFRYYMLGGTLLGAIRHKDRYQLFDLRPNSTGSDSKVIIGLKIEPKLRLHLEILIWIDVIPLDGMPDSKLKRFFHKLHLSFWWNLNQMVQYDELVDQKRKRSWKGRIAVKAAGCFKWLGKLIDYRRCLHKINKTLMRYPYDMKSKQVINFLAAYGFKETFDRSCFESAALYPFV